jgi:hypothetical protein
MRQIIVPIAFFVMVTLITVGRPLVRAWARRLDATADRTPALGADAAARLERMELAIETIAVEIERLSEGQRFTTKLLSERGAAREPVAKQGVVPAAPAREGARS